MEKFNILVVCGPTAGGKTELGVNLALRHDGEIISGDSRQVYRGMDIGTGKDLEEYTSHGKSVKYHLINIADPMEDYNLYRYIADFHESYDTITAKGKLPVLAGGSGLYIEGALKDYSLSPAPENAELRSSLNDRTKDELMDILRTESEEIFKKTDTSSTRRIIRGIEIARYTSNNQERKKESIRGDMIPLIIGINLPREELLKRIDARLDARLKNGMVDEVKMLLENGVAAGKLLKLGLEYRYCTMYLKNEISFSDMVEKLKTEIHKFSKRQMTWFRGMERRGFTIHWVTGNILKEAEKIVNSAVY